MRDDQKQQAGSCRLFKVQYSLIRVINMMLYTANTLCPQMEATT